MAGRRSDAVQAAHDRLRHRLEGQLRIVQAFVRAEEQLKAAQEVRKALEAENQARLKALAAENQARVAKADEAIRTRKAERAETLAGLAVVVNDNDETAALVSVSPADVTVTGAERGSEIDVTAGARPDHQRHPAGQRPAGPMPRPGPGAAARHLRRARPGGPTWLATEADGAGGAAVAATSRDGQHCGEGHEAQREAAERLQQRLHECSVGTGGPWAVEPR